MKKKEKVLIDTCSCSIIHNEIVEQVKANIPKDKTLLDLASLFKVFGEMSRIKILHALSKSEMCVCDIAALLEMNQSTVSHQLRVLKQAKLVNYRRDGKVVYYSLSDEHIINILNEGKFYIND